MMKTNRASVGAFEAKNKFSELLLRVGRGMEVTNTKHDRPVALLIIASAPAAKERKGVTAELRVLRKHYSLKGIVVCNLIEEGRR